MQYESASSGCVESFVVDALFYFDQQDSDEDLRPMGAGGGGGGPPSKSKPTAEGCNAAYAGSEFGPFACAFVRGHLTLRFACSRV